MTLRAFHDHVRIGTKYQAVIPTFITWNTSLISNLKHKSSYRKREHEGGEHNDADKCRDAKKTKTKLIKYINFYIKIKLWIIQGICAHYFNQ